MEVPAGFELVQNGSDPALVRRDLAHLSPTTWWSPGRPLPGAKGRGDVALLEPAEGLMAVARTYRRGGALGGFLRDRYPNPRRAFRELNLLAALGSLGVPAVEPLAAVARRHGALFRLRLVTTLVPGARPLTDFMGSCPKLRRAAVEEAGRVVGAAFDAGLRHRDLHPDNLLAQESPSGVRVLLMDLDRARLEGPVATRDRDRMLVRMARYLHRHRGRLAISPGATDRLRFLRAMGLERRERRAAVHRLAPALHRSVAWHRLSWRDR